MFSFLGENKNNLRFRSWSGLFTGTKEDRLYLDLLPVVVIQRASTTLKNSAAVAIP